VRSLGHRLRRGPASGGKSSLANMFIVYIIQSIKTKRYYIGTTFNLEQRIKHHNSGANRSTRNKGPWEVVYKEFFGDKREAWLRERQIKSYKGGEAFKKLINHGEVA